jgi:hypothetical protein
MIEDLGSIGRQMQIDRVLDSQVAKLVFGLTVELRESGWGVGLYADNDHLPNYSGDIKLAWSVLEKLQQAPENSLAPSWECFVWAADANPPLALLNAQAAAQYICEKTTRRKGWSEGEAQVS